VLACVPASEFFKLDNSRRGLLDFLPFYELLTMFRDDKQVPCKWLKSFSDKILAEI
jgi:hypothetical protein